MKERKTKNRKKERKKEKRQKEECKKDRKKEFQLETVKQANKKEGRIPWSYLHHNLQSQLTVFVHWTHLLEP